MREILTALWRRFVHRRKWERDMDDELKFHIEARAADLRRRGVPEPEATRQARVEFGGVEGHKELCREASWPARTVDECTSNLRHALRSLAKHRGFAAVGVISLALVIGASLATFSLIDRLMLTTLDVRDPDALYQVGVMGPEGFKNSHSYVGFDRLRLNTDLFDAVAWSQGTREVEVNGAKNNFTVVFVSGSYFPLLGGQARLGRTFAEQDDRPGADRLCIRAVSQGRGASHGNTRFRRGEAEEVADAIGSQSGPPAHHAHRQRLVVGHGARLLPEARGGQYRVSCGGQPRVLSRRGHRHGFGPGFRGEGSTRVGLLLAGAARGQTGSGPIATWRVINAGCQACANPRALR
jgi:hypothetical protein